VAEEIPPNETTSAPNKRSIYSGLLGRAHQYFREADRCLLSSLSPFCSGYFVPSDIDEQSLDVHRSSLLCLCLFNHDVASDGGWDPGDFRGNIDLLCCYCYFLGEFAELRRLRAD